jgi:hypothetical protein
MNPQERKEVCREEVVRFLAERSRLKHAADAVRRGVNRGGFDFSEEEILAALQFTQGMNLVAATPHQLGATAFFQITAAGTLAFERGD